MRGFDVERTPEVVFETEIWLYLVTLKLTPSLKSEKSAPLFES